MNEKGKGPLPERNNDFCFVTAIAAWCRHDSKWTCSACNAS